MSRVGSAVQASRSGAGQERSLSGKRALVTGSSRGIGAAIARGLAAEGASVCLSGRDPEALAAVAASLRTDVGEDAPDVSVVTADLYTPAGVDALVDEVLAFWGGVDILVNNAGVNGNGRLFAPGAEAAARSEMEVNYLGLLGMIRAFAPAMQARRSGAVVNLLSFLAHVNLPVMATYCASKAAAYSLTQAARAELARFGVRVLGVFPRLVDTAMSGHISAPKLSPAELAGAIVNALEQGVDDLYPGNAVEAYEAFRKDPGKLEREFAARLPD